MSKLPDLQAAVRRIDGVASATIRWPDPEGPATLRVEFAEDADRAVVTEAVMVAMRELAGVDVEDIRLDVRPAAGAEPFEVPAPEPAAAEEPAPVAEVPAERARAEEVPPPTELPARPSTRPVLSSITVEGGDLQTRVKVTLAVEGRTYVGVAEGLATRRATPRTAAVATLTAVRDFLPADTHVELDWVDVIEPSQSGRPPVVQAAVTRLTRAGEEIFLGSAIVRTDLREAAVRATLDALNRQLFRWRESQAVAAPA